MRDAPAHRTLRVGRLFSLPAFLFLSLGIFCSSDASAQTLYSVTSAPGFPLITIDPNTGAIQTIQPTGSFGGIGTQSAFDPISRRLFFLVLNENLEATLVVVNVQTGAVTTHTIPLPEAAYAFLEFDPATGKLYSVTSAPGFPLITIDPNTGTIQTIQPTGSFGGIGTQSAFDPISRRLFFLVLNENLEATLVVVNVQTGAVTTHTIPLPDAAYAFLEFAGGSLIAIPTLSGAALAATGLLLALLGFGLARFAR